MARDRNDIQEFLESGLLEDYLLGITDESTSRKVEQYIDSYAEVRQAWDSMQQSLEIMALEAQIPVPADLKSDISKAINADSPAKREPSEARIATIRRMNRMVVAASVAAFVFATLAITQWSSLSKYKQQVADLTERVGELETELDTQNKSFAQLESEFSIINDPNTQKVIINGNDEARGFVMVAYWNKAEKTSLIRIVNQPDLPNRQCFQLWADVHGEMVSLGVIPEENGMIALDFKTDAESLNVTIEPEGGSEHPTVSRLVGSVSI
jgi:anti-sigma-K factor RskA